jgi:hypothetical protein
VRNAEAYTVVCSYWQSGKDKPYGPTSGDRGSTVFIADKFDRPVKTYLSEHVLLC